MTLISATLNWFSNRDKNSNKMSNLDGGRERERSALASLGQELIYFRTGLQYNSSADGEYTRLASRQEIIQRAGDLPRE